MATDQLSLYGDARGIVQGDDQPTKGTYVRRDSNGNVNAKGFTLPTGSTLVVGGGLNHASTTITGAASIVANVASVLEFDATTAAFTATLPAVSASAGVTFMVTKIDATANLVTLQGSGSDVIQSPSGSANTYTGLSAVGKIGLLYCDGTKWRIGLLA